MIGNFSAFVNISDTKKFFFFQIKCSDSKKNYYFNPSEIFRVNTVYIYNCDRILYKVEEDGRTAPGVCGNGSAPLGHSRNVVTHTYKVEAVNMYQNMSSNFNQKP